MKKISLKKRFPLPLYPFSTSLPPPSPSPPLPSLPPSLIQGLLLGRIWCHSAQSSHTVLPPRQLISQVVCSKKIIGLSQGNITQDKQPLLPRWRGKTGGLHFLSTCQQSRHPCQTVIGGGRGVRGGVREEWREQAEGGSR